MTPRKSPFNFQPAYMRPACNNCQHAVIAHGFRDKQRCGLVDGIEVEAMSVCDSHLPRDWVAKK